MNLVSCQSNLSIKRRLLMFVAIVCLITAIFTIVPINDHSPIAYADELETYSVDNPDDFIMTINSNSMRWGDIEKNIRAKSGALGVFGWGVATTAAGCNPHFSLSRIAVEVYRIANLKGKLPDASSDFSLIKAGQQMYDVMKLAGLMLIILYFLIEILDEVQADHFTVEHLIKKLITLAVAILVLEEGGKLFGYIIELGDAFLDDAALASISTTPDNITELYNELTKDEGGFLSSILKMITSLGVILEGLIGYLLGLVALLVGYFVSFSRFIEILVRFAFAPIGMAQLVSGGAKGAGMRYIKKFASAVLQGAVCVMTFGAATTINYLLPTGSAILGQIIVPITVIGFLMKSKTIADDIVGV